MTKDRKERLAPQPVVFFDADKTLWKVIPKDPTQDDWASKGDIRSFFLEENGIVKRSQDDTRFVLKDGVEETLNKLVKEGVIIGIISDNEYEDVEAVGQLLGIWHYFDKGFINIRLWKGKANKSLMISEITTNLKEKLPQTILLVDDNEIYAGQMAVAGHNFILSPKNTFPSDIILDFFGIK